MISLSIFFAFWFCLCIVGGISPRNRQIANGNSDAAVMIEPFAALVSFQRYQPEQPLTLNVISVA